MRWLGRIIKCLSRFEPDRDESMMQGQYKIPIIEELPINVSLKGKYKTPTGQPKGVVIHYTAGRSFNGRADAVNSMQFMASQGLGSMVMDKDGIIYQARNQGFDDVAFHAGKSEWRGKKGLSYYCMGLEICSAGLLDTDLKTWYGEQMPASITRTVEAHHNIQKGVYHRFTVEQEEALFNFLMWQIDVNKEFDIGWIVGHDEVCVPHGRKADPGGSLSMSMPELRAVLQGSRLP